MAKKQADRLKAYMAQVVTNPHLSDDEKIVKINEFVDKIRDECKNLSMP